MSFEPIEFDPEKAPKVERDSKYTHREYIEAYNQHGSARKAAEALGVSHTLVARHIRRQRQDRAVGEVMKAIGTKLTPRMVYYKTHKTGEPTYTVLLKPEDDTDQDLTEYIAEKVADIPAIGTVQLETTPDSDLLTIYPIMDAHIGMRAWGEEVGEDWDSEIAVRYITKGIAECVAGSPASNTAIIINGGDMLHADDNSNQTPRSKHALDVDTRHFRTVDVAISLTAAMIEMAAKKHETVIYRSLRGNHDERSYMMLTFALFERYRDNPRIIIEKDPSDFFVHQFGKVMIAAHHGDKANATNLVLHAADRWPEMWGSTKFRYYYIGHRHHKSFTDVGGMSVEMLRAATKRDSYADSHSYCGRSELRAITYHREKGEWARKIVNY